MKSWLKEKVPFPVKMALKRQTAALARLWNRRITDWSAGAPNISAEAKIDFDEVKKLVGSIKSPESITKPKTSIIIPVFNKAAFTFHCLRSLLDQADLTQTEVIVVNNNSTDDTSDLLSHFSGHIRVINNDENLGFVDACNQGASLARGDYLLFLNNDTIVLPGWLTALIDTLDRNNDIGAAGSLFLYPSGKIQEAGAFAWKTGATFHYGRGKWPEDHRFNFAREVDYCSGASLLIRKELFARLGGFDKRFAPAYEDVDLCFGVRSLGYRVVFQPASRLIHYEGVTAGRNVETGYKHFQKLNQEKFYDKWKSELEQNHFAYDKLKITNAAQRIPKEAIIVLDDRIPTPDLDAGSARMFLILKLLRRHYRTLFVYKVLNPSRHYEEMLWQEGIETAGLPHYRRLLKERKFRAAIVSRPDLASDVLKSVRRYDSEIKIIFDMVDAHFLRLEQEYEISGNQRVHQEAQRYRQMELQLFKSSDLVWCTSSSDMKAVNTEVPGTPTVIIPTIHIQQERGAAFEARRDLLFIGNFNHRPNKDAIIFFIEEIFPLIRRSIGEVKFHVVGSNAPKEFEHYASDAVCFHGYVPDIGPIFRSSRVFVAPLRFGAGVKGKIGDALSYGLPVITTTTGASGMRIEHGRQALITDQPDQFAAAVVQVYEDATLWQKLSDAGYKHIANYFSPEAVEQTIISSIA